MSRKIEVVDDDMAAFFHAMEGAERLRIANSMSGPIRRLLRKARPVFRGYYPGAQVGVRSE